MFKRIFKDSTDTTISQLKASVYTIVDSTAAFIHQNYLTAFNRLSPKLIKFINEHNDCEQVVMNMLAAENAGQGPILLTSRGDDLITRSNSRKGVLHRDENLERPFLNSCLAEVVDAFGSNYLQSQQFRLDPMWYKDRTWLRNKRYKLMDAIKI